MRDDLMVQQQVANTWQHMVGVICLNQTNRKQVKAVLPKLFKRWATHTELLSSANISDLEKILKPLGMQKKKAERIYRMSQQFSNWNGDDATELYGIGKYGSDSYKLFYKDEVPTDVGDHELNRYIQEEMNLYGK
jgi:methyl-CpG-binding domain protein 4